MKVFRGLQHPGVAGACALTIGNFDGVHRGHQAMVAQLRAAAAEQGLPSCVLTFEPHPRDWFAAQQRRPDGSAVLSGCRGGTPGPRPAETFRRRRFSGAMPTDLRT